jgi:hypothetical protein
MTQIFKISEGIIKKINKMQFGSLFLLGAVVTVP